MKMNYYYNNPNISPKKLCTEIEVDLIRKKISIVNHTDNNLYRAFGINEHPTWIQFEDFLCDRCVPKERYNIQDVLDDLGLNNVGYDPLEIIRITKGRMAEDHMELEIV